MGVVSAEFALKDPYIFDKSLLRYSIPRSVGTFVLFFYEVGHPIKNSGCRSHLFDLPRSFYEFFW